MILLLGGTGVTAEIALGLAEAGYRVLVSKATDVPLDVGRHAGIESRWGELDERGLAELIARRKIRAVVDATHPYATVIRGRARRAAAAMKIPYFSFLRPGAIDPHSADVQWVADHAAAARGGLRLRPARPADHRRGQPGALRRGVAADGSAPGGPRAGPAGLAGGLPPRPESPTSASWPDAAPSRSRRTAATSAPSASACW